jgi:hypothetical protein
MERSVGPQKRTGYAGLTENETGHRRGLKTAAKSWEILEARAGVEPTYTDLQSGA